MANIRVIEPEEAEGELKAIYDQVLDKRGKIADVHKIQSLNPKSILTHMELYMNIMFGKSPLKRAQREMIAVIVSKSNNCEYCQIHHGEALNHYWKDDNKIMGLRTNFSEIGLDEVNLNLCRLAEQLTIDPSSSFDDLHENLKRLGLDDRAILDATLVISYFNFVNRIVLSLGVSVEADLGAGFNY